ncbi:rhodanese-like sulfurtransferase [Oleiphilus messinensis]|uniref:Rhodanese-like sulfurtransferase n=1 Tax=Oleiphilus messinensis TaxID=141451 RepID=A0A1Y0I9S6_9GAMM|nr:DUF2892 domain-containing protein [Oleiphilus messinensis]ARU56990.1 rhodanese-like sulfurtransferase [Oleiphilus messinensis]
MTINEALRFLAGTLVLFSILMGHFVHPYWFFLTGFVALNLIQSAFTKWCPAMWFFNVLGLKKD